MTPTKNRAAWIVEWELHPCDLPLRDLHPHILPHRWHSARVFDYMRCLYWNSALWTPWEALDGVNCARPQGVINLNEGSRLVYGMSAFLVASHVKDLCIKENDAGKSIMEWTSPAGTSIASDKKRFRAIPIGNPTKQRFVFED